MESEVDGEERVIATAEQIVRRLATTTDMTQDMLSILSTFDHRFSNILDPHLDHRLQTAENLLLQWNLPSPTATRSHHHHHHHHHHQGPGSMIWDGPPDQAQAYLDAVDEVHYLMNKLHVGKGNNIETLERAQGIHDLAMARLADELRHSLLHHNEPLDPQRFQHSISRAVVSSAQPPPPPPEEEEEEEEEGELEQPESQSQTECKSFKNSSLIYLVCRTAIPNIRAIVKRLIAGDREQECCQVYSAARRTVLDENLSRLGIEKLGVEDVQKTPWEMLEEKIKKWIPAAKVAVRVLFAREKEVAEQIFEDGRNSEFCVLESCRAPMMRLLGFSEAVAISRRSPEKLFRILDIYETLSDLVPDISFIFSDEGIRAEACGILVRLGEAASCTFTELGNAIRHENSRRAIPGGAVHPLTRYVMNYIRFLFDYTDSLKLLIVSKPYDYSNPSLCHSPGSSPPMSPLGPGQDIYEDETTDWALASLAHQLFNVIELLKNNLDGKSRLYKDSALTYLFLMNNIHYIVQKVRGSELMTYLGDDWVRKHSGKVRQYATNYQRVSWNKVVSCLRDEGMHSVGGNYSNSVSKGTLKERFKRFNTVLEEVYKTQTTWIVPDPQLREELRISVTEKLLPAYRSFMGRIGIQLESDKHAEKYLKYSPEELEEYLLGLFEGLPGSSSARSQRTRSLP